MGIIVELLLKTDQYQIKNNEKWFQRYVNKNYDVWQALQAPIS